MSYPIVTQVVGSLEIHNRGTKMDRSVSGRPRFRTWYTSDRREFTVVHDCDDTDKQALMSHYDDNYSQSFSFTWQGDGQTYTVQYKNAPTVTPTAGAGRWRIKSELVVV